MTTIATSRCRSCQAKIRWARTETGKAIPIDAEPTPDGNVTLSGGAAILREAAPVIATVHAVGTPLEGPRWTSHFATCAQAAQHRKRPAPEPAATPAPALEAEPAERRPDWAPCAGCGHRVINPAVGEPRCPGCQPELPAGITRVDQP
ncbi:hypothetical protein MXD62_19615 [Frankia sp. Mgl5]|uniref:hypothetical protein n=1 Tax=Frankia sp. Mgl5 TaxID=2933793 RepID=UPI00200BD605|nr:hypothetical protein [Frankia sp. Mgl5]MCK9929361.1 hypothetical protein [Frankia sp. Mgl5]